MNKRGVIQIVAWLLIAITTAGIGLTIINSTTLYIGDIASQKYVNYYKCPNWVDDLQKDNVVVFPSKKEADIRFNATEGCV